jgi:hypothetical protein
LGGEGVVLTIASRLTGVVGDLVGVAGSVDVEEGLLHAEDDDTGRRGFNVDGGATNTVGVEGDVDVAVLDGTVGLVLANADAAEELAARTGNAEEEDGGGGGNGEVDSDLDGGEDGEDDGSEETGKEVEEKRSMLEERKEGQGIERT